jgi:hypothetical protein
MLLGITLFSAVAYTKYIRKPRSQRPVAWILNELDAAYFNLVDDSVCLGSSVSDSNSYLFDTMRILIVCYTL